MNRNTGSDFLGLDHIGDQLLNGVCAASGRSRTGARTNESQEITTIELRHASVLGDSTLRMDSEDSRVSSS
jgi:hypothetical protein